MIHSINHISAFNHSPPTAQAVGNVRRTPEQQTRGQKFPEGTAVKDLVLPTSGGKIMLMELESHSFTHW